MQDSDQSRHDLIDLYLRGQLRGEELEAFELRLLEDDELYEEVRRGEAMHEAFKSVQPLARDAAEGSAAGGATRWLRQPLSVAAALALCVSLAFNALLAGRSGEQAEASILPVNTFAVLETSRGGGERVSVPGAAPYLLQIDVGFQTISTFSIRLLNEGGVAVFEQDALTSQDGWLRIVVGEPLAGEYRLEVDGGASPQEYILVFPG